jgi:hypothetical protein
MALKARLAAVVIAASLFSTAAHAQSDADKAAARQLGQEGQSALEQKDFKTAEDRFKRADALYHAPTLALGLARAQVGVGKLVAAQETYNRIIRDGVPPGSPAAFGRALEDAKKEVDTVAPRIGSVVIQVTGFENPKVTLDDVPVPVAALGVKRPADPGVHTVKATADGYKPAEGQVTVTEGGSGNVALTLEKDPNAAPPPPAEPALAKGGNEPQPAISTSGGSMNKTAGIVALGVGGAGIVFGAITGIVALGKHSDVSDKCGGNADACDPSKVSQSDIDSYHTMGTLSTVGFIVGGVGLAAGAVLLLTAPKSPKSEAQTGYITPYVGLGAVGARGTF